MDIGQLHRYVTTQFSQIRTVIDETFASVIHRATRGSAINMTPLIRRLNTQLRPFAIRVVADVDRQVTITLPERKRWYPPIGAYCYQPKAKQPARIRVTIGLHQSGFRLRLTPDVWYDIQHRLVLVIQHELVHRAQYAVNPTQRVLAFRPHTEPNEDRYRYMEQQYFGDLAEIEAYARDCVEEWRYHTPDIPLTIGNLREQFATSTENSALMHYRYVFGRETDHPAVARLFTKVLQWASLMAQDDIT